MSEPAEPVKKAFAQLQTAYDRQPADHDAALMRVVRMAVVNLKVAGKDDKKVSLALKTQLKDHLVNEANKLASLTNDSNLLTRWRLRESQFLTVASRLAIDTTEVQALQYRALLAEQDFETKIVEVPDSPIKWAFLASELEHRMNKLGHDRYGFPPLFNSGVNAAEFQSVDSIRRVPGVVAALKMDNFAKLTKGPKSKAAPVDPRPALSQSYKKGWKTEHPFNLYHDEGAAGDVDLVWGSVSGQPRLMLRAYYKGARLMVDHVAFGVSVAHKEARMAKDKSWDDSRYSVLRVPSIPVSREVERARKVVAELDMAASREAISGPEGELGPRLT